MGTERIRVTLSVDVNFSTNSTETWAQGEDHARQVWDALAEAADRLEPLVAKLNAESTRRVEFDSRPVTGGFDEWSGSLY
jgi:hypothetical protein